MFQTQFTMANASLLIRKHVYAKCAVLLFSVVLFPSAQAGVLGYVDGLTSESLNPHILVGWACSAGLNQSIDVHLYAGGPAGSGTFVGGIRADSDSEPAVASACGAQGTKYRFRMPLTVSTRKLHAGKKLYVHAISPIGESNDLLSASGVHSMPGLSTVSVTRSYVYDDQQRLCKRIEPETGATIMDYDAVDNLAWTVQGSALTGNTCDRASVAAADKTVHSYNSMNRLVSTDVPGSDGDKSYLYAADGLVTQINNQTNGVGTVNRYFYNKRRMLNNEQSEQAGWYNWGLGYTYDNNGALSRITYPTTFYVDYVPNALGQPTQAASEHGSWATNVQYYPNGAVKEFRYGNGVEHRMTQNARQLPYMVTESKDGTNISGGEYRFDANGNNDYFWDYREPNRLSRSMSFDGMDRLTQAYSGAWAGYANYQYDALDNLKRSTLGAAGFTYNYDANNRLARVDRDAGGSYNYAHNGKGAVVDDGRNAYNVTTSDRINEIYVTGFGTYKEGYRYDGNNRRVLAWTPTAGSILSMYSQSGQLLYQQNDREGQNYEYIYLGDDLLATRNCCIGNAVKTRYQHTDALGSPVATTDEAGVVVERTEYAPYGAPLNRPVSGVGYTGHVMDSATGLVYAQQRYYDPMMGRFLSVDPMESDMDTGWNFNRYNYAANNPYKYTDPDGRMCAGTNIKTKEGGCSSGGNGDIGRDNQKEKKMGLGRQIVDMVSRRVVGGSAWNANKREMHPTKISERDAERLYGTSDKLVAASYASAAAAPIVAASVEAAPLVYASGEMLAYRALTNPTSQRVIATGCFAIGCMNGDPGKGGNGYLQAIARRAETRQGIVAELRRRTFYIDPAR